MPMKIMIPDVGEDALKNRQRVCRPIGDTHADVNSLFEMGGGNVHLKR